MNNDRSILRERKVSDLMIVLRRKKKERKFSRPNYIYLVFKVIARRFAITP